MAGIYGFVMGILYTKTVQYEIKLKKIRKTRQQIDQGSLFLMDSTFGLKIIYSAKKTHYNMHGIF